LQNHSYLSYVFGSLSAVQLVLLYLKKSLRRAFPLNYLLLLIFTLTISTFLAIILRNYNPLSFYITFGLTLVLFGFTWLYVFFSKNIISFKLNFGFALFVITIAIIFSSLYCSSYFSSILTTLSIMSLFSFFLNFDLKRLISKEKNLFYGLDDYVTACLDIYIDLIVLFVSIVSFINCLTK
jgi:FtsH-binding integral membrane protein